MQSGMGDRGSGLGNQGRWLPVWLRRRTCAYLSYHNTERYQCPESKSGGTQTDDVKTGLCAFCGDIVLKIYASNKVISLKLCLLWAGADHMIIYSEHTRPRQQGLRVSSISGRHFTIRTLAARDIVLKFHNVENIAAAWQAGPGLQ